MKPVKKSCSAILLVGMLLACGCAPAPQPPLEPPSRVLLKEEEPPAPALKTATLMAVGDNLIHDVIYQQAQTRTGGKGFDFAPVYEAVAPLLKKADVAVVNQETLLASREFPLSSYPTFCSPVEVGMDLEAAGFSVFTLANNHSFDKGAKGIRASLDYWDSRPEALAVGMYRDSAQQDTIRYKTVKGIKIAFLAYTELTNGLFLPADAPEGITLLSQEEVVERQVRLARETADFVVVSPHWGTEGAGWVNDFQKEMAQKLCDWGADLILGSHPHVIQPCQVLTRGDGGQTLVIYSLGNFVSAQSGLYNMAGGLLEVRLEQQPGAHARVAGFRLVPTVTHYGPGYEGVRVIPLADYTPQLAQAHGIRSQYPQFGLDFLEKEYRDTYPDCLALPGNEAVATLATLNLSAALEGAARVNSVHGMALAAFSGGKVVYSHSYGMAKENLPVQADTIFRAASISKAVTSVLALRLAEEGKLDLDGDISQYLGFDLRNPAFPQKAITLRMLMTHTSSIADTQAYLSALEQVPYPPLTQLVEKGIFLGQEPGTVYSYSNLAAGMMAGVVEGASGQRFWVSARQELLEPLGLEASYNLDDLPNKARIANHYQGNRLSFSSATLSHIPRFYANIPVGQMYLLGQGDLYITAPELAKLGILMAGDGSVDGVRILQPETVAALNRLEYSADPVGAPPVRRGLGVQLTDDLLPGRRMRGHQGNAYGMIACLFYDPADGTGVAFLTNGANGDQDEYGIYEVNRAMVELVYGQLFGEK